MLVAAFAMPVYDMVVVRRLNPHGHLNRDADRLLDGQSRLLLDIFLQGNAFHQLHHDIVDSALLADVVHVDDIGVHQSRRRLRLDPELGHKIRVLPELLLHHLDRNKTIQLVIFGFIYI